MPAFTVFYSHPYHCPEGGQYTIDRVSAKIAGEEAADMLPEDLSDDEEPEEMDLLHIRDDLDITVFAGTHTDRPSGDPDWKFE